MHHLRGLVASGLVGRKVFFIHHIEVPRGEKMLYSGTDPESYITEYTLVTKIGCMEGGRAVRLDGGATEVKLRCAGRGCR